MNRQLEVGALVLESYNYLYNPIFGVNPGNFAWNFYDYRTQESANLVGMYYTYSFNFELIAEMATAGLMLIADLIYFNLRDLGLVKRIINAQRVEATQALPEPPFRSSVTNPNSGRRSVSAQ